MKLENQVCNLELAKKLKELGVKQESYFYWWSNEIEWFVMSYVGMAIASDNEIPENYSAFTVVELGEMLPDRVDFKDGSNLLSWYISEKLGSYHRIYYKQTRDKDSIVVVADTEADARAAMLIYLIENKLITL